MARRLASRAQPQLKTSNKIGFPFLLLLHVVNLSFAGSSFFFFLPLYQSQASSLLADCPLSLHTHPMIASARNNAALTAQVGGGLIGCLRG